VREIEVALKVEHDAFDGERDYVLEFLAKRGWPEV